MHIIIFSNICTYIYITTHVDPGVPKLYCFIDKLLYYYDIYSYLYYNKQLYETNYITITPIFTYFIGFLLFVKKKILLFVEQKMLLGDPV